MEKGGDSFCTYGLSQRIQFNFNLTADDITFTNWNASIISPSGVFITSLIQERIYELSLICGDDYPDQPPKIKFINKINMACVNQTTGWVNIQSSLLITQLNKQLTQTYN